jgi:lactate dehydrogenase-like 2-hydroxyacid dehydrogenase
VCVVCLPDAPRRVQRYLEAAGHELIVTSDKDGPGSEFERHLADAEVVISQPFFPAYLTAERIAKAPKLKLALTAGIGSDHVDLEAAAAAGITVAEVAYCNSISVAEHVLRRASPGISDRRRRRAGRRRRPLLQRGQRDRGLE